MKLVDNFQLLMTKMTFNSEDEFYFVQILIRGKDGHTEPGVNGNNKNRLIKFYTIKSIEHLQRVKEEIQIICNQFNARAYIHPTKRSFLNVANECLRVTTEMFLSKNNMGLKGAYSTACGKSYISSDKMFIVDLDDDVVKQKTDIIKYIEDNCEPYTYKKLYFEVPTVHGLHLITKPFNTQKFKEAFPNIDVHKNNPTLLYYVCKDD